MSIAWECDICGKLVKSEQRKSPKDYFMLSISSDEDDESGFSKYFSRLDLCHDCYWSFVGYVKTQQAENNYKPDKIPSGW